jgi:hypothetical protein
MPKYSLMNKARKLQRKAHAAARRGEWTRSEKLYRQAQRCEDRFDGFFMYVKMKPTPQQRRDVVSSGMRGGVHTRLADLVGMDEHRQDGLRDFDNYQRSIEFADDEPVMDSDEVRRYQDEVRRDFLAENPHYDEFNSDWGKW